MSDGLKRKAWMVMLAGTGINLALGILYTWSIFKAEIQESVKAHAFGLAGTFDWALDALNDPYALCCLIFAFAMIPAGRVQDRFSPRLAALIGGVLVGVGFILSYLTMSYGVWLIAFGVLAGTGIGFGYAAATPAALKWFPASKTGMVAGIVVSGFGLASVYIAPLARGLLGMWREPFEVTAALQAKWAAAGSSPTAEQLAKWTESGVPGTGVQSAMLFFGVAFLAVVSLLALILRNPPKDYDARAVFEGKPGGNGKKAPVGITHDIGSMAMLKTGRFWLLWTMYVIGAGAGLMVISSVAGMAKSSLKEQAFIAVALLAVGNAAGRIIAGLLSDKIGRAQTLFLMLLFQAVLMFVAIPIVGAESPSAIILVVLATLIGFNYGTNLSLFPAFCKDNYGIKNFGSNYGVLFTAWGVGGLILSRVSQTFVAGAGDVATKYSNSFMAAGILLVIAALLTFTVRRGAGE